PAHGRLRGGPPHRHPAVRRPRRRTHPAGNSIRPGTTAQVAPHPRHTMGDAVVDLAVELIRTDSVNPGLVPGAAGEAAMVELLASRLDGFAVEIVTAQGRPSLVATRRGAGRGIVLNGHLDTVGVSGMDDPVSGRIVGETGR